LGDNDSNGGDLYLSLSKSQTGTDWDSEAQKLVEHL